MRELYNIINIYDDYDFEDQNNYIISQEDELNNFFARIDIFDDIDNLENLIKNSSKDDIIINANIKNKLFNNNKLFHNNKQLNLQLKQLEYNFLESYDVYIKNFDDTLLDNTKKEIKIFYINRIQLFYNIYIKFINIYINNISKIYYKYIKRIYTYCLIQEKFILQNIAYFLSIKFNFNLLILKSLYFLNIVNKIIMDILDINETFITQLYFQKIRESFSLDIKNKNIKNTLNLSICDDFVKKDQDNKYNYKDSYSKIDLSFLDEDTFSDINIDLDF
jgi:regulator of replication initiation timing